MYDLKSLNKIGFFKIDFFIRVGDDRVKVNVENGKDVRDVYQVRLEIDDCLIFILYMVDVNVDIGMNY